VAVHSRISVLVLNINREIIRVRAILREQQRLGWNGGHVVGANEQQRPTTVSPRRPDRFNP